MKTYASRLSSMFRQSTAVSVLSAVLLWPALAGCDLVADFAEELSGFEHYNDNTEPAGGAVALAYANALDLDSSSFADYRSKFTDLTGQDDPANDHDSSVTGVDLKRVYGATNGESLFFLVEGWTVSSTWNLIIQDEDQGHYVIVDDTGQAESYDNVGNELCTTSNDSRMIKTAFSVADNLLLVKVPTGFTGRTDSSTHCWRDFNLSNIVISPFDFANCSTALNNPLGIRACDPVYLKEFYYNDEQSNYGLENQITVVDIIQNFSQIQYDLTGIFASSTATSMNIGIGYQQTGLGSTGYKVKFSVDTKTDKEIQIDYDDNTQTVVGIVIDGASMNAGCFTHNSTPGEINITFNFENSADCLFLESQDVLQSFQVYSVDTGTLEVKDMVEATNLQIP